MLVTNSPISRWNICFITQTLRFYSRFVANQSNYRTKTKVRYWWEIYRVLVTTRDLRHALGLEPKWQHTLAHYQSWDDVTQISYDEWWNSHQTLFVDESAIVREIKTSHFKRNPYCLYVELNLSSRVADLLSEARNLIRTTRSTVPRGKNKNHMNAVFHSTQGAEIRPSAYEDYIVFLEKVYAPNCRARAIELRECAQKQFRANILNLPSLHLDSHEDGKAISYVSIKRYRDKIRRLCRAVARGEFPGSG